MKFSIIKLLIKVDWHIRLPCCHHIFLMFYIISHPQIRKMKLQGRENKTAVVVGTITDDVRIQKIPNLKVSVNDAWIRMLVRNQ